MAMPCAFVIFGLCLFLVSPVRASENDDRDCKFIVEAGYRHGELESIRANALALRAEIEQVQRRIVEQVEFLRKTEKETGGLFNRFFRPGRRRESLLTLAQYRQSVTELDKRRALIESDYQQLLTGWLKKHDPSYASIAEIQGKLKPVWRKEKLAELEKDSTESMHLNSDLSVSSSRENEAVLERAARRSLEESFEFVLGVKRKLELVFQRNEFPSFVRRMCFEIIEAELKNLDSLKFKSVVTIDAMRNAEIVVSAHGVHGRLVSRLKKFFQSFGQEHLDAKFARLEQSLLAGIERF